VALFLQTCSSSVRWMCGVKLKDRLPSKDLRERIGVDDIALVWYGMVNVDLYSAIITKVSNALDTLVSGKKPGFQTLSEGLVVLLCAEVVRQRVPDHGAVHSKCSASNSG